MIYHLNVNEKFEKASEILFLIASNIHKSFQSLSFSKTNINFAYCRKIALKITNNHRKIINHNINHVFNISIANSLDVVVIKVNSQKDNASQLNSNIRKKSFNQCAIDLLILLFSSFTK